MSTPRLHSHKVQSGPPLIEASFLPCLKVNITPTLKPFPSWMADCPRLARSCSRLQTNDQSFPEERILKVKQARLAASWAGRIPAEQKPVWENLGLSRRGSWKKGTETGRGVVTGVCTWCTPKEEGGVCRGGALDFSFTLWLPNMDDALP